MLKKYINSRIRTNKEEYEARLKNDQDLVDKIKKTNKKYVVISSSYDPKLERNLIADMQVSHIGENNNYYIINNHGAHWDTSVVTNSKYLRNVESSGADLACGCYTILQIIANDPNIVNLEKISESEKLGKAFEKLNSFLQKKGDKSSFINRQKPKYVRYFINKAISNSQYPQRAQRVLESRYELTSDDIIAALDGLGVHYIERSQLHNIAHGFDEVDMEQRRDRIVRILNKQEGGTEQKRNALYNAEISQLSEFLYKNGLSDLDIGKFIKDIEDRNDQKEELEIVDSRGDRSKKSRDKESDRKPKINTPVKDKPRENEPEQDQEDFTTPEKQIRRPQYQSPVGMAMLESGLNKLIITPEKYKTKAFVSGRKSGSNKGKIRLDNRDTQTNHRNPAMRYPIITQSSPEKYDIVESSRGTGNDELFQTAKLKKWKKLDEDLGLKPNDESPTFEEAFSLARVKTKELHNKKTGHIGAIFKSATGKGNVTAGYFKESGKKGSKKGWDPDKDRVIDAVVDQARTRRLKKQSPIKATAENLKLAVRKTAKYSDGENAYGFSNYTSAGLDLSDEIERDFALKTSQAARDKWKMSIVTLEDRWNDQDSEGEDHEDQDLKSVIKRKVERTKIDPLIHGGQGGTLSPARTGTPYSNFNFDYNFEQLEAASKEKGKDRYKAVATVFAQPTPPIKPTLKFKQAIKKAQTEPRPQRPAPQDKETLPKITSKSAPAKKSRIIIKKRNSSKAEDPDKPVARKLLPQLGEDNKKEKSKTAIAIPKVKKPSTKPKVRKVKIVKKISKKSDEGEDRF